MERVGFAMNKYQKLDTVLGLIDFGSPQKSAVIIMMIDQVLSDQY
jgi:hypothetical protein